MSLCPNHVEAARPVLWRGPLPASRPSSVQLSPAIGQIGLQRRETGVMLEKDGEPIVPDEGPIGDIG